MPYKSRTKPKDLAILELLHPRMNLTGKDLQHYLNLKKGFEGELYFDSLTEKLQCECLILNDLLLEVSNTTFQIDTLIITERKTFLYEIKNLDGDYYYEADKLIKKPKFEINNPLLQLGRSESLLRQLLLSSGFNHPIDASVVFINPTFTMYQAPLDKPIIFPSQVKNYLSNVNAMPSKLTSKHRKLADKLLSLHITDSPYEKIPPYDYEQLQKGISCPECHSFSAVIGENSFICKKCQHKEPLETAVLRSIKEFKTLFPDEKIITNIIYDWCQAVQSKRRIRNILLRNFTKTGENRWSHFV